MSQVAVLLVQMTGLSYFFSCFSLDLGCLLLLSAFQWSFVHAVETVHQILPI